MELELIGKIIWFIGLITWVGIRTVPNRRARKTAVSKSARSLRETISMVISFTGLGIIPLIWVFSGEISAYDHTISLPLIIVGAVIFIYALYLFRVTHKALGKMWSVSLDLREDHKLVTHGIYEKVRHPMYSAFWLWALSQPFLLANWIAGFSGIIGFGTLYFLRLRQEEKMMEDEFGEDYREYSRRTKRIIPYIY